MPVVLHECETLPLTLREEQRSKVSVNDVLGKILGPGRDEVTGEWRRLHNEELYDLYCSPKYYSGDQIKNNKMGGACRMYGGWERCIQGFGGKPEGKRPLGRHRCGWEDKIKMDHHEEGLD